MKIYQKLFPLFFLLLSCSESTKNHEKKEQLASRGMEEESTFNEKSNYDTLYTKNTDDNKELLHYLKSQLKKEDFTFEERKNRGGIPYENCNENRILLIKGNGIRDYIARSTKPHKGTTDFYPDFILLVYEFPTNEIAQQNFDIIKKAMKNTGCHELITVDQLVINGNEIFLLNTRAEMFRTYIDKYGEMITNFHHE